MQVVHAVSEELRTDVGVPRESVLGFIAYALYIADLINLNLTARMFHCYADGIQY